MSIYKTSADNISKHEQNKVLNFAESNIMSKPQKRNAEFSLLLGSSGSAASTESSSSFDAAQRRAKVLESRLEQRVQVYSVCCSRIEPSSFNGNDVEGGMSAGHEEQSLSREVELDLTEMMECIDVMRSNADSYNNTQQEVLKRYHEVHFDYSSEYRKANSVINGKRENAQLMRGAGTSCAGGVGDDNAVNRLLRERNGISSSLRGVNEVLSQAFDAKEHLLGQRGLLGSSGAALGGLARNIPGLGKLVDGISTKRLRENAIVILFCGVLTFFSLWWVFLR